MWKTLMTKLELEIFTLRKLIEKDRQRLLGMKNQKKVSIIKRTQNININKLNNLLTKKERETK